MPSVDRLRQEDRKSPGSTAWGGWRGARGAQHHTFAIEQEQNVVRFYVDEHLYETRTPADVPGTNRWVYDHPFFPILNVAVGGPFPGPPDATTVLPQTLTVDYVRVYAR